MPLDHIPDLNPRAEEIDDATLLAQRVLYRIGRVERMFGDPDRPMGEKTQYLRAMNGHNRSDLRRLETLLGQG